MTSTNLYSVNKFGGIPVRIFFSETPSRFTSQNDNILVCEWLNYRKALYIDNNRVDYLQIDNDKEALKSCLFQAVNITLFDYDTDYVRSHIDTYTGQGPADYNDSRLISEFLFRDFERMKEYNEENQTAEARKDILREREIELEKLKKNLIEFYSSSESLDPIQTELLKKAKKQTHKHNSKQKEIQRQIAQLQAQYEQEENDKEVLKREVIDKLDPTSVIARKQAVESSFNNRQENTQERQENRLQAQESSIPEEIRRKATWYIEHGFLEEVEGAGHYRILQGLDTKEFAWIVSQVRARKTRDTFKKKELPVYVWNKENEQCSFHAFKDNSSPEEKIEQQIEKLLSC